MFRGGRSQPNMFDMYKMDKEPSRAFIVVHTNPQFDIQRSLAVFMHVPISGPSMMTTISGQIPERCSAVAKMQNQLKTTIFYLV